MIKNNIGKRFTPYIKIRFTQIENKEVCGVYIHKSTQKAFLKSDKGTVMYIRTGNSSQALGIPDIYDYI